MIVVNSRKKSPVTYSEIPPFFSLVDYRNNYFTSEDPNKIIEFYNGFENRDQLIQWMRERPKGVANIHEVEGDKDIIVVIPTADFNGKYARECRDSIFKGLHIIFVESGEVPDPYFNYAHNCNVGIRKAMEYNPKWVVVSNDDMVKMDDVKVMKMEIDRIERSELNQVQVIFAKKGIYHSRYIKLGKQNFLYRIFNSLFKGREGREILGLEKRFKVEIMPAVSGTAYAMFFNNHLKVKEVGDFIIINQNLAEHVDGFLYDETYINDTEDVDLSIRINYKYNYKLINYNISEKVSGTFGTSKQRAMRGLTGVCYLNSKIDLGIYQILVK